jgi:sugar/nucleoside kinase (ribokinase family)
VEVKDTTGAGDVFAAAFLSKYTESFDASEATDFANCVASFAVEGEGTNSIPTLEQIEKRLKRG